MLSFVFKSLIYLLHHLIDKLLFPKYPLADCFIYVFLLTSILSSMYALYSFLACDLSSENIRNTWSVSTKSLFFLLVITPMAAPIGILPLPSLCLPLPDSDEYILSMKANKHPYRRVSLCTCPEINAQQFCISCWNTLCNSGLYPEEFLKVVLCVSLLKDANDYSSIHMHIANIYTVLYNLQAGWYISENHCYLWIPSCVDSRA